MHLVNRVPKRVAGEGAPDVMHYYAGFEKIRNEARVASKTPEDAGFAGQLLGRAVASVVGTEGVSEEDPLMKVERMEERMQAWEKGSGVRRSGDLKGAYSIGVTREGPTREVMEEWLEEVKERLEFDRVFEMLKKHIERQEIQRNWRVC